jgi:hypothetical protein
MRSHREHIALVSALSLRQAMSRSPEVVQILPVSASVSPGGGTAAPREREPARKASSAITKVAWVPHGELDQGEWLATGRRLGVVGRCSQWWVGDWIRYGTARWGEKYTEAARVTGYDVASLRNMAWVAACFDSSLRSDKLSWSHHVLLAPLTKDEQVTWIARAIEERLSVADLRLELRAKGRGSGGLKTGDDAGSQEQGAGVCPHCGHKLSESDD